ncbi:MAG: PhnD/SsuA/transferrin family substrate-binding protein [Deltaproteobacteria bacterium]|nr:PhnD/SsuA/transferrin family substrate-binding protein [Deltaproteobacteria bacterium]
MKHLFSFLVSALYLLPTSSFADAKTIRFAVTDISGLEELHREFQAFQNKLSEFTGMKVELTPVSSRTAVAEALRTKKLDLALSGPAEYVVISKRTKAYPVVGFYRPDYFSAIITLKKNQISNISELKGKKIAFGEIGSTSYYLAPLQILKDNGLNPSDVQPLYVSKNIAWEALKRGSVKAIGFNYERFQLFLSKEKELSESDYQILAKGEDLPNDLIIAGTHVPKNVVDKIRQAFDQHSDELSEAILVGIRNKKYQEMKFTTKIQDKDYDLIRKMYATAGYPEYLNSNENG